MAAKLLSQLQDTLRLLDHLQARQLGGFAEADNRRHIESARPEPALVATPINQRRQMHSGLASYVQGADSLGAINFVGADGHQIGLHFIELEGDFSQPLNRIAVEESPLFTTNLADRARRMNRSDFVIGEYPAHQKRPIRDRGPQLIEIQMAAAVHG